MGFQREGGIKGSLVTQSDLSDHFPSVAPALGLQPHGQAGTLYSSSGM